MTSIEIGLAWAQPSLPGLPSAPLLGTSGTELLLFGLLVAVACFHFRRQGRDPRFFVGASLAAVSLFYFFCPEDSAFQRRAGDALMSGMAAVQAGVMQAFGLAVRAEGNAVVGIFRFEYARGCMGLSYLAMAILCLAVHPLGWKRKLLGGAALVVGMLALNLVRLIVLYQLWAGMHFDLYRAFHRVGGAFFALCAAGLFAAVVGFRTRPRTASAPSEVAAPARA